MTTLVSMLALLLAADATKHVKFDSLPATIQEQVKARYPKAKVVDAEQETARDGKVVFEITLTDGALKTELAFTSTGVFLAEEKAVSWASVPADIKQALANSKVKDLKVERAEEVTTPSAVSFELVGRRTDGSRVEVVLTAQGVVEVKPATE